MIFREYEKILSPFSQNLLAKKIVLKHLKTKKTCITELILKTTNLVEQISQNKFLAVCRLTEHKHCSDSLAIAFLRL